MTIFSERLKELRQKQGLSCLNLGKAIGVSDATICRWELGQSDIKSNDLVKLAIFFGVPTDYLLGLKN